MSKHDRIDVHQHIVPPFWVSSLDAHGGDPSGWASPDWSPDIAKRFMDDQQIAKGVLSLTAPSVTGWKGDERKDMARRVNDYAAELSQKEPERFGAFATLPLPDVDAAVQEAERALDQLGGDGVILLTNYNGRYLGDRSYDALWAALNARRAVVFVHPGVPEIPVITEVPGPIVDYPFDTSRSAVHMVQNGVLDRYPDLKIILSHGGGFLPYASHRFAELLKAVHPDGLSVVDILERFSRFYFDTALSTGEAALPSLMAFARPGHVLFGSDFPYAPASVGASFTRQLDGYSGLTEDQRKGIDNQNASRLFGSR